MKQIILILFWWTMEPALAIDPIKAQIIAGHHDEAKEPLPNRDDEHGFARRRKHSPGLDHRLTAARHLEAYKNAELIDCDGPAGAQNYHQAMSRMQREAMSKANPFSSPEEMARLGADSKRLIKLLDDESYQVRLKAQQDLMRLGSLLLLLSDQPLQRAAQSGPPEVRRSAGFVYGELVREFSPTVVYPRQLLTDGLASDSGVVEAYSKIPSNFLAFTNATNKTFEPLTDALGSLVFGKTLEDADGLFYGMRLNAVSDDTLADLYVKSRAGKPVTAVIICGQKSRKGAPSFSFEIPMEIVFKHNAIEIDGADYLSRPSTAK